MSLNPKASQNLSSRWSKKQVDYENLEEGETTKQKGRPMGKTSREDGKSHMDIP
jgi:hypothetical protein